MSSYHKFLTEINEQFQRFVLSNGQDESPSEEIKKSAMYLAAYFKHSPEKSYERDVIETLEVIAAVCPVENAPLYQTCHDALDMILTSIPTQELEDMWAITDDINLCSYIANATPIQSYLLFEKLCFFVEKPKLDPVWFRKFIEIIKARVSDEIDAQLLLPFTIYIQDGSPLRSTLGFIVLNTFSNISPKIALAIVAAWIVNSHKTQYAANHCRLILKKAPTDTLNMIATLAFDVPIVFAILPPSIDGYQIICLVTVHRVMGFYNNQLVDFLSLCDVKARDIIHHEFKKKKIEVDIPGDLQLYDEANTAFRSRNAITKMLNNEMTVSLFSAAILFARMTTHENASFLPPEISQKIYNLLRENQNTRLHSYPLLEYDKESMKTIFDLLKDWNISEVVKLRSHILI